MVLNAVRGRSRDLPRDRGRLRAEDLRYFPSGFDPSVPRFTQDTVIGKGQKTTLIRAMRTFDKVENRGYILVEPR